MKKYEHRYHFTSMVRVVTVSDTTKRRIPDTDEQQREGSTDDTSCLSALCGKKHAHISQNVTIWGYRDIRDEQQKIQYIKKMREFYDEEHILIKEFQTCCRLNCVKRMEILLSFIKDIFQTDLNDDKFEDEEFESPLMLSISAESTEAAMFLIKNGGKILVAKMCKKDRYKGATALHFAIMNGNEEVTIAMLKLFKQSEQRRFVSSQASGKVFQNMGMSGSPPHLALQCGHPQICFLLVDNGAELDCLEPETGNTVIHTLVDYGQHDPKYAKELLGQIFTAESTKNWYCRRFIINIADYTIQHEYDMKTLLLNIENKDGYTPLTYSAKLGVYPILLNLVNCEGVYRFTQWRLGSTHLVMYDMTQVDSSVAEMSAPGKPSVLQHLVYSSDDEIPALAAQPISHLIQQKWSMYSVLFTFWMLMHASFMTFETYAIIMGLTNSKINGTVIIERFWVLHNATASDSLAVIAHDMPIEKNNSICIAVIVLGCLYSIVILFQFTNRLVLFIKGRLLCSYCHHYKVPLRFIFHFNEYHVIFLLFVGTTISWPAVLLTSKRYSSILLYLTTSSLLNGWAFLLYFCQAYESTCYFVFMVKRILITDMLYFSIVLLTLLVGFTFSVFILSSSMFDPLPNQISSISNSFYTMSLLVIGIGDLGFLDEMPDTNKVTIIMISYGFLILCLILMLNMVIAAMSDTYASAVENRDNLLWKLRIQAMSDLEMTLLPRMFKHAAVQRFVQYHIENNMWVLPVKESNVKQVIN